MANEHFCCFRIHTIGLVIGWLGTIGGVLTTALVGIILGHIDKIVVDIKNQAPSVDSEYVRALVLYVLIVGLILAAIYLLASVLLILGTVKNIHLLIVPWLVNSAFSILFTAIITGIGIPETLQVSEGIFIVPGIISLIFQIILWLAIYQLFRTIREQTSGAGQPYVLAATEPSYIKF